MGTPRPVSALGTGAADQHALDPAHDPDLGRAELRLRRRQSLRGPHRHRQRRGRDRDLRPRHHPRGSRRPGRADRGTPPARHAGTGGDPHGRTHRGHEPPGATADLGPGGPPAARTTGPAGGDRPAAVSSGTRTVRSWPLLVLAAPAAAEVWTGWVGIAQKTGFGLVSPLPGIWPSLHLDTSITLPVGVEAYAAYALRAWLADGHSISDRTRRFAKWSAICSFALGMAGQVAYHLLAQAGAARAPWPVTMIVSCLPVLVLAMGTTLAHMLRADAGTAADGPDHGTGGPAVSRSPPGPPRTRRERPRTRPHRGAPGRVWSFRRDQDGPAAGPRHARAATAIPRDRPGTRGRQQAYSSGKAGIAACPAQRGNQGLQPGPERPGAHDQRRAGGRSSSPGQSWQRGGVNLIPPSAPSERQPRPVASFCAMPPADLVVAP